MKAKEYLKNIEKIDRLIEEKLLQKEEYSEINANIACLMV